MIQEPLLASPHVTVTAVVVIVGIVTSSWLSLRKLSTRERFRTSRFKEALKDSSPQERPEIIRALNTVEDDSGTEARESDPDTGIRPVIDGLGRLWRDLPPTKDR